MSRVTLLIASSIIAIAAGIAPGSAADIVIPPRIVVAPVPTLLPAVSAPNAKFGIFGGSIDNESGWGVDGAFSIPLHQQWELQIDGMGGSAGGSTFWGAAGHLFWRDPSQGLFGVYASWVDWSPIGAQVSKIGGEAAWYHGQWTFSGILAAQSGDFTGVAGSLTAAYYLHDDFRIDASYRYLNGVGSIGTVGAEWQHSPGFSLFANGSWGQGGYGTVIGGIKLYHGPQKSLIRRQREDDPEVILPLDLFTAPHSNGNVCPAVPCPDSVTQNGPTNCCPR